MKMTTEIVKDLSSASTRQKYWVEKGKKNPAKKYTVTVNEVEFFTVSDLRGTGPDLKVDVPEPGTTPTVWLVQVIIT